MVSRAVGAAALLVLAASSVLAQQPEMPAVPFTDPSVSTAVDPMLGSGPSALAAPTAPYRFWFDGGYQAGFIRNIPTPTNVANQGGTLGVQGAPGVTSVLGGGDTSVGTLSGGRFQGGFWFDQNHAFGFEASVFFLSPSTTTNSVGGGSAVISRPFFDTSINAQNVRLINLPGQVTGSVSSTVKSQLWGGDLGAVVRVIETDMLSLDQLFYFRHVSLEESQDIIDNVSPTGGAVTFKGTAYRGAGTTVSVNDSASVINHFYGGGAGLRLGITPGRFSAIVTAKVAVGATSQSLRLDGTTTLTGAGNDQTAGGGLLVPAGTSGRYNQSEFTWMPEVGVKLGYQITQKIGVYVAYDFLYMSNVGRPGNNFSTSVNPTQLPSSQNFGVPFGPGPSAVHLQTSDFWMNTLGAGFTLKF